MVTFKVRGHKRGRSPVQYTPEQERVLTAVVSAPRGQQYRVIRELAVAWSVNPVNLYAKFRKLRDGVKTLNPEERREVRRENRRKGRMRLRDDYTPEQEQTLRDLQLPTGQRWAGLRDLADKWGRSLPAVYDKWRRLHGDGEPA